LSFVRVSDLPVSRPNRRWLLADQEHDKKQANRQALGDDWVHDLLSALAKKKPPGWEALRSSMCMRLCADAPNRQFLLDQKDAGQENQNQGNQKRVHLVVCDSSIKVGPLYHTFQDLSNRPFRPS
jgi:hypothetical protein